MEGCEYCIGDNENYDSKDLIATEMGLGKLGSLECYAYIVTEDEPRLKLWMCRDYSEDSEEQSAVIRYCPMCGRKLK